MVIAHHKIKYILFNLAYVSVCSMNFYTLLKVDINNYPKMPPLVRKTNAVINIRNNEYCFLYLIVTALYSCDLSGHPNRPNSCRNSRSVLNFNNISVDNLV